MNGYEFDEERFHHLLFALKHGENWRIRSSAAEELGRSEDPRAFEPLLAALEDSSNYTRASALLALAHLGDPRALEPLLAVLAHAQAEPSAIWAFEAVYGLKAIGGKRAAEALLSALPHPQLAMRMRVIQALGEMKIEQAVPQLIMLLKDDPESTGRSYTAMALGEIGDCRAVEPLIQALHNNSDQEARRPILRALGKLRDPRAVAPLIEVVQHENPHTACFAAEALGEIGDSRAFESLLYVLEHWDTDEKKWVRSWAASALGRLNDGRGFEPLIKALHDKDPRVRIGSAHGLGFLGDVRAIPALRQAHRNDRGFDDDTGDTVKGAARKAMSRITDRYNAMPSASKKEPL